MKAVAYLAYNGFDQIESVYIQSDTSTFSQYEKSVIGNYGSHPLTPFKLKKAVKAAKQEEVDHNHDFYGLIGNSPAIPKRVKKLALRTAGSLSNVLIEGKAEQAIAAGTVHSQGLPAQRAFVAINCGAITKGTLAE